LYEKLVSSQFFYDPALHEGSLRIPKPNISPPRKVILALDAFDDIYASSQVFGLDERRSECS
jgi:hypothetical protein